MTESEYRELRCLDAALVMALFGEKIAWRWCVRGDHAWIEIESVYVHPDACGCNEQQGLKMLEEEIAADTAQCEADGRSPRYKREPCYNAAPQAGRRAVGAWVVVPRYSSSWDACGSLMDELQRRSYGMNVFTTPTQGYCARLHGPGRPLEGWCVDNPSGPHAIAMTTLRQMASERDVPAAMLLEEVKDHATA